MRRNTECGSTNDRPKIRFVNGCLLDIEKESDWSFKNWRGKYKWQEKMENVFLIGSILNKMFSS